LSDADGEAAETGVWLDFALRFGFISADIHCELNDHYNHICSQLTLMMADPGKWALAGESKRSSA